MVRLESGINHRMLLHMRKKMLNKFLSLQANKVTVRRVLSKEVLKMN